MEVVVIAAIAAAAMVGVDVAKANPYPFAMSNQTAEDFFNSHGLDIPPLDSYNEEAVKEITEWHWATHPTPTAMQDYLLESVEYLKGAVPDQYSMSHAGHGLNSYSLNFRYVGGDFAILAQSGWGGVYMDEKKANDDWDHLQLVLSHFLINAFIEDNPEVRIRKYLIVFSDFRLEDSFEFWVNKNGEWIQNQNFSSLESVCEHLIEMSQS